MAPSPPLLPVGPAVEARPRPRGGCRRALDANPRQPRVLPGSRRCSVGTFVTGCHLGSGATGPEPVLSAPRAVNKRRYNMALFGGALLLASYTADRLLMGDLSKSGVAWVPLVGPWFLLTCSSGSRCPTPPLWSF